MDYSSLFKILIYNGVSPYALTWDDENYYMVAYDSDAEIIKHYRVDKMADISITDRQRDRKEHFESLDMGTYAKKVFGMFSGEERSVRLRVANHLVGAILDRFGEDVSIVPDGDDTSPYRLMLSSARSFSHGSVDLGQI